MVSASSCFERVDLVPIHVISDWSFCGVVKSRSVDTGSGAPPFSSESAPFHVAAVAEGTADPQGHHI